MLTYSTLQRIAIMRKLLLLAACGISLVACEPYSIEAGQRCCSYSPPTTVKATIVCFVEPNYNKPEGYEVIGYTNIDSYEVGPGTKGYIGFHVPCPQGFGGGS
jgi:hypothetical protein